MGAHITAQTKSLCGHLDLFSFSSPGRVGRFEDRLYATSTLCGSCRAHISELVMPQGGGYYKLNLPQLAGRPRSVTWAKSIRLTHIRYLGPKMLALKKSTDPMAAAALAAFEMLFKVTDAQFWIDGREFAYDSAWAASEIEHLLRKRYMSMHASSLSAYCYWMRIDPSVIETARKAVDAPDALFNREPGAVEENAASLLPHQPSVFDESIFI